MLACIIPHFLLVRILSLAPSNTEILYAIGAGDDIVGATAFCDEPPAAMAKPKVGGWTEVYGDLVERFAPDLVVTSMFLPPEVRALHDARPELFCHVEPSNLESVFASIEAIGARVGRMDAARAFVARMRNDLASVAAVTAERPKVRMYIEEWSKPPMVSGNWVPEVAAIAGVEQVIARPGERSRAFDLPELVAANPECIILSICGARDRVPTQEVLNRLGWGVLRAVQQRRITVLDDSLLNRPGPRLVVGAGALARLAERVRASALAP